jgi:hypothetical protein
MCLKEKSAFENPFHPRANEIKLKNHYSLSQVVFKLVRVGNKIFS